MQQTISKLSRELNLPPEVIIKVNQAFWLFIRTKITELPLKDNLDKQSFNKLRTNFNIPNLGKLTCTYDRYKGTQKRTKLLYDYAKHKRDKANG